MNESFLAKLLCQQFSRLKVTHALFELDTYPMQGCMFELDCRGD